MPTSYTRRGALLTYPGMILSPLGTASPYEALSPSFATALRFCHDTDWAALPNGRHPILGDDVFALLQENHTKPADQCRWEAHRTYADIQLVLAGTECMGVAPLSQCEPETAFDTAADLGFYRLVRPPAQRLIVPAGHLAIFLPTDVHMPLIADGAPALVRKVVVKVRVGPT